MHLLHAAGVITLCNVLWSVAGALSEQSFTPVAFGIGNAPAITGLRPYPGQELSLSPREPLLTLDYGADVAGFPFVEVSSLAGPVAEIELKYSEQFAGLKSPTGDGPWLYVNGLMNSFRTETFNITSPNTTTSFFIQGGQRWQSIQLLSNASVTIRSVGFRPSVDVKPTDNLVGAFVSSNDTYNGLWDLGARAVQLACVDAYSQPSTWEISEVTGAFIRGQQPGLAASGASFGNYTLTFSTKIDRGGTGWKVASELNQGYGAYFVLTSNRVPYSNTDTSVVPPNHLIAGYGYSIVNFYLDSATPHHYANPFPLVENEWYRVTTVVGPSGYNISVNGTHFAYVPYSAFAQANINTGSWGFGPFLDQAAYVKDVKVFASNGSVLYADPFTSIDILQDYSVASNQYAVCLDGAKRDREVWIGDFAHTARELAASSGRYDYIQSMIEYEFLGQLTSGPGTGLVPIQNSMGTGPQYQAAYYPSQYAETDYQLFFILTLGDYFVLTSDTAIYSRYWSRIKLLVDSFVSDYLDHSTYLLNSPNASWFTAPNEQNATAPTALFATGLRQLVTVANALHDTGTADYYSGLYSNISTAINTLNWNPSMGTYNTATGGGGNGVLATAFPIRAGIANASRAEASINALSDLFYIRGYTDTKGSANSPTSTLSPNTQSFLLESLFIAYCDLHNEYSTGASWEYVAADGAPGLGLFTSLSHPWGGAPTYVLTAYVLGVRREELNSRHGQYGWVFDPPLELMQGLGLQWAKGKVPLAEGGWIEAAWEIGNGGSVVSNVTVMGGASGVHVDNRVPTSL